jgi:uncharacterized membrane protein YedE/YeeE
MLDRLFPNGLAHYLQGGLLIGAGVSLLFVAVGLIGGMSTFFSSTWSWLARAPGLQRGPLLESRGWRLVYAGGVMLGAALFLWFTGERTWTHVPPWRLAIGGLIAGFGARLGGGCTSGHGVCGLSSLQLPSLLAVVTFLATAMVTAQLVARFAQVGAAP